ncbi:MAG: lipid-A-disaccharide synthase [Epsilonproteobacteria bacterium]|nr:lipid-A-disaccharide synthase [Campylobacterota bacterium]
MKKIFIVTGELSGDRVAAWYLNKRKQEGQLGSVHAVGGDNLLQAGAQLYERFEKLNVVGVTQIIKHLPFLLRFLGKLTAHIIDGQYDEVVLVDFPGFNLMLAKRLKKRAPNITITYVSPPQLWCWGAWRVKKIRRYIDSVVVLYPFEVDWYAARGIKASWIGLPMYQRLEPFFGVAAESDMQKIAVLPGSRTSEIETLLPLFLRSIQRLHAHLPDVRFVLPQASSISQKDIMGIAAKHELEHVFDYIDVVTGSESIMRELGRCSLALSKPGTSTLELALLGLPAVVVYKTSWLTYVLARPLVKVQWMSLPNLLLNKPVYTELIQWGCSPDNIAQVLFERYCAARDKTPAHQENMQDLRSLRMLLE